MGAQHHFFLESGETWNVAKPHPPTPTFWAKQNFMIFHERTSTGESLLSYLVALLPNWVTGVTVHIAIQQGHRTGGYGVGNGVPSLLVNWSKIDIVIYLIYFGGLDMYILPNPTRDHISMTAVLLRRVRVAVNHAGAWKDAWMPCMSYRCCRLVAATMWRLKSWKTEKLWKLFQVMGGNVGQTNLVYSVFAHLFHRSADRFSPI